MILNDLSRFEDSGDGSGEMQSNLAFILPIDGILFHTCARC